MFKKIKKNKEIKKKLKAEREALDKIRAKIREAQKRQGNGKNLTRQGTQVDNGI